MFRILWKKKFLVVFLVAMLVLFPAASVKPAQALSKTIFLSVGLEKTDEGYIVLGTVADFAFTGGGELEVGVVSADGATIPEALDKITASRGRKVSLAHCNLIVLGSSLATENVAKLLEYFLEKFEISSSALLVWTDADVEKVLQVSIANETGTAGGLLETIAVYNQEKVFNRPLTLDRFYKDYLHGREGFMSVVSLESDEILNTKQLAVFIGGLFISIK